MIRILFVCHGNICRSPMAEFIMKDLVEKAGSQDDFYIESAATSTEELGNPVYPPARRVLEKNGISCAGKYARQITKKDYSSFDHIICMDNNNIRNALRFWGSDPDQKITRLLDHTNTPGEVADPWYYGNFDATWRDVLNGCSCLLEKLSGGINQ